MKPKVHEHQNNNLTGVSNKILLFLLFATAIAQAQIVNIPDPLLKARLVNHDPVIDTNDDSEIQVSEALATTTVWISGNGIDDMTGIEAFTNLLVFGAGDATFLSLDVSMMPQLASLTMTNGLTTTLILGSSMLDHIDVQQTNLTALDVSGLPQLTYLDVHGCGLATLDFGYHPFLTDVIASGNELITLDVSGLPVLNYLELDSNNLISVNMKNGSFESTTAYMFLFENDTLQFVCADEEQIAALQQYNVSGAVVINSYCSFFPGDDYNTITGVVTFDDEDNGCDASDIFNPMIRMNFSNGSNQWATFTNAASVYNFYTGTGNFTVSPGFENPSYFTVTPASASVNFPTNDNIVSTNNFCVAANGVHPDLDVVIAPIVPARPGFDAIYLLTYRNKGNQILSGNINMLYQEPLLDFVSATVAPSAQISGSLTWNYTDLLPFESRSINVTLDVNSPTDTLPVNIDDELNFSVTISPATADETPTDNAMNFQQVVVGSHDPNSKQCVEGNVVSTEMIGDYLHYIINFENLGTDGAVNIVVRDTLDTTRFDINTLRVLSSSHAVDARINGNIAEFIFENINLEIGGHGNILLKIKTRDDLAVGDIVSNRADIYFDYNHPVDTGYAHTTFQQLSIGDPVPAATIAIYPNPTNGMLNITAAANIQTVQLFDIQGRLLQTAVHDEPSVTLDISQKRSGIYFVKVTSVNGVGIQKIVKE